MTRGVSVQQASPSAGDAVQAAQVAATRRYQSGFRAVAFALLIVMASATLSSPLYGLYRVRDHLSELTVTVIW